MMAAMDNRTATCGYNCQDYSDAVALRKEERINLCEPGKETNRMLGYELGSPPALMPADAMVALAAGCFARNSSRSPPHLIVR